MRGTAAAVVASSPVERGADTGTEGSAIGVDAGWVAACPVAEIPVLGARIVRGAFIDIAVFRTADERVFALHDRCPHRGGPLSQGIVYGNHVACPLHNWQIDLGTGRAEAPDDGCARRFDVRVVDGIVQLPRQALSAADDATAPEASNGAAAASAVVGDGR